MSGQRSSAPTLYLPTALLGPAAAVRIVPDQRGAESGERRDLIHAQLQGCCAEIIGELLRVSGSQDNRGHGRLCGHPGERDLRQPHAARLGDLADRVDDGPRAFLRVARCISLHAAIRIFAKPRRACRWHVTLVLAGEPAAGERRPREQTYAGVDAGRHDFEFDLAHEQIYCGSASPAPPTRAPSQALTPS